MRNSSPRAGFMRGWRSCSSKWGRSPLRQLQLDPAVAAEGVIRARRVEGLEFAEAGRNESLRRDALADEVLHHRDRARGGEFPVGRKLRACDRAYVGVTV